MELSPETSAELLRKSDVWQAEAQNTSGDEQTNAVLT